MGTSPYTNYPGGERGIKAHYGSLPDGANDGTWDKSQEQMEGIGAKG